MLTADPCEHHSTREEADDDTHMRLDRCGIIGRKVCGEAMQSIRAAYESVIPIPYITMLQTSMEEASESVC